MPLLCIFSSRNVNAIKLFYHIDSADVVGGKLGPAVTASDSRWKGPGFDYHKGSNSCCNHMPDLMRRRITL